jgi:hypothetical protein
MQKTFEALRIFHSGQLPVNQHGVHGFYQHDKQLYVIKLKTQS